MARAVLDALTDVAYEDDEQVVKLTATKEYGDTEGVTIRFTDREKLRRSLEFAETIIDENFKD